MPRDERESALQEAKLLANLQHPNIVSCVESFVDKKSKKLCIVQEWCAGGDAHEKLKETKRVYRRGMIDGSGVQGLLNPKAGQFNPRNPNPQTLKLLPSGISQHQAIDWFTEILLGMKHVHDRKILHRDLKTQNIFLTGDGRVKLGDFGVSKVLGGTHQLASTAVGTPYYLSPEICQNKKYNNKSDVWSLGCVFYELLTGQHPFDGASLKLLVAKITKGVFVPVTGCSLDVTQAVKSMLQRDPSKRPTVNELLQKQPFKTRAEILLDPLTHVDEFSHTVLHTPKKGMKKVTSPTVGLRSPPNTPVLPPVEAQRSVSTSPERSSPVAPFAPRLPSTKKTSPKSPPTPELPRTFAVKKLTKPPSQYPNAHPLPFRRGWVEPLGLGRLPSGVGAISQERVHRARGSAPTRFDLEVAARQKEAAHVRELREAKHRERALVDAASRIRAGDDTGNARKRAERDRARREFKDRQNAVRAARRVSEAVRGRTPMEGINVEGKYAYEHGDDVAIYVSGARRVRDETSPPLPLHVKTKEQRVVSPVKGISEAGKALRDVFASKPAVDQFQSQRAAAYWDSKAEAERNWRRVRTPEVAVVPPSELLVPSSELLSLELLTPDCNLIFGADTAPPDSIAAAAIVHAGRLTTLKGNLDLFSNESEMDQSFNATVISAEVLPSDDALPSKVLALRKQLINKLGFEKFTQAYTSLDGMDESVDAAYEAQVLVKQLGSDVAVLGKVHRLLVWEDALREREERGGERRGL